MVKIFYVTELEAEQDDVVFKLPINHLSPSTPKNTNTGVFTFNSNQNQQIQKSVTWNALVKINLEMVSKIFFVFFKFFNFIITNFYYRKTYFNNRKKKKKKRKLNMFLHT